MTRFECRGSTFTVRPQGKRLALFCRKQLIAKAPFSMSEATAIETWKALLEQVTPRAWQLIEALDNPGPAMREVAT